MKTTTKGKVIKAAGLGIDVLGPLAATLSQFPVWIEKSSAATISGMFLVFALLACVPLFKQIKEWMKTPSVPVMYTIGAVIFISLREIIDQMAMICIIGAVSNGIGALVYKFGDALENKCAAGAENEAQEI